MEDIFYTIGVERIIKSIMEEIYQMQIDNSIDSMPD